MRRIWAERRAARGLPDTITCQECGGVFRITGQRYHHQAQRKFCSMKCRDEAIRAGKVFKRGAEHHAWIGDAAKPVSMRSRGRVVRLRESDGYCERCGFMLATETHHLDRDPLNNDRSNLEFLCIGCHDLAHIGETIWELPLKVAA